jgi:hypothetical protein
VTNYARPANTSAFHARNSRASLTARSRRSTGSSKARAHAVAACLGRLGLLSRNWKPQTNSAPAATRALRRTRPMSPAQLQHLQRSRRAGHGAVHPANGSTFEGWVTLGSEPELDARLSTLCERIKRPGTALSTASHRATRAASRAVRGGETHGACGTHAAVVTIKSAGTA